MKKALLFKSLAEKKVQCLACCHSCVLSLNEYGICRVKKNIKGILYSLVYGKVCALAIDPIEKKPFFHFFPGSSALSLATVGCNFSCLH